MYYCKEDVKDGLKTIGIILTGIVLATAEIFFGDILPRHYGFWAWNFDGVCQAAKLWFGGHCHL